MSTCSYKMGGKILSLLSTSSVKRRLVIRGSLCLSLNSEGIRFAFLTFHFKGCLGETLLLVSPREVKTLPTRNAVNGKRTKYDCLS